MASDPLPPNPPGRTYPKSPVTLGMSQFVLIVMGIVLLPLIASWAFASHRPSSAVNVEVWEPTALTEPVSRQPIVVAPSFTPTPVPMRPPTVAAVSSQAPILATPVWLSTSTPTPSPVIPTATINRRLCPRTEACITSPYDGIVVRDWVSIIGTATRPAFQYYKFEFRQESWKDWSFLVRFEQPVSQGKLMDWNTTTVAPGRYRLRLVVVDRTGNYWPDIPEITIVVVR